MLVVGKGRASARADVRSGWVCVVLAAAIACLATGAGAQTLPPAATVPNVVRIEVEGNHQVPVDQILQWFGVRAGDRFDPGRVARAVRELTSKKRFEDVRIEGENAAGGIVLHVVVREYPHLDGVRIVGAKKLKEKDIRDALKLATGSFLTPAELRVDQDKITSLYKDKGYFRAVVRDTLVADADGKQALQWQIEEGEKVRARDVAFVGNDHIAAKPLGKLLKRDGGFLSLGDELRLDALPDEFEKIAGYYRDRGYLDAQVVSHDLDVGKDGESLLLRIHVQEGPRYTVGTIGWSGNTVFGDSLLQRCIRLRQGAPFSEAQYDSTTAAIYSLYNDRGYIHFNAVPKRDIQDHVVNVAYEFSEGDPSTVGHVRIAGNTKTHDNVILREFLILPGDKFDRSKLMRSIREVYSLGFFDDAGIQNFTPRDDGTVDLELKVMEKQTGQLGAGAGYSAVNAVTGFIEVAETNLFGSGNRMSFRWEFSKRQNDVDFSYSMPWLFDTPTSLGIDLYNSSRRSAVSDFYRDKRTGGSLTVGRRLDFLDYSRLAWRFRAESIELTDFSADYTGPLRARFKDGRRKTISTGLTLRRDSTNDPFFPSAGSEAELSSDLIGTVLGGDESYARSSASLALFQPVGWSRLALMLRTRFGLLRGLRGHSTPDYELFRLGGSRYFGVRGYDDFEIVPAGNPAFLGGQAMSIYTAELTYPFSPKFHGVLFADAGNTWTSFRDADLSLLKKGAGVGVRVQVPMLGQLGLDYGYGFDRVDALGRDRDSWNLHFNFGQMF